MGLTNQKRPIRSFCLAARHLPVARQGMLLGLLFLALSARADLNKATLESARKATALVEIYDVGGLIGWGSAFCVDPDGIFITNEHVATQQHNPVVLTLVLNAGTAAQRALPATIVRLDAEHDLAILRVERAGPLESLELGGLDAVDSLEVSTRLTFLGFPLGGNLALRPQARPEVSISTCHPTHFFGKDGKLTYIQTEGTVNHGNSGGPTIDDRGRVVGVVRARLEGKGVEMVNFIIPSTIVQDLLAAANITLMPKIFSAPLAWTEADAVVVPPNRPAPPSQAACAASLKIIRELMAKQYADTSPAGRRALASALLETVRTTKDDPASRYVLLREAADVAVSAADAPSALVASIALGLSYNLDPLLLESEALTRLSPKITQPQDAIFMATNALALLRTQVHNRAYSDAAKLIPLLHEVANKTHHVVIIAKTRDQIVWVEALATEYGRIAPAFVTLGEHPGDPASNFAVGRFYCLRAGDFGKGLPLLVRTTDPAMKSLAAADLANPTTGMAQKEIADLWVAQSTKEAKRSPEADSCNRRAVYWYEKAQPNLQGIAKTIVQQRLDSLRGK
jgi:hypothetical protein